MYSLTVRTAASGRRYFWGRGVSRSGTETRTCQVTSIRDTDWTASASGTRTRLTHRSRSGPPSYARPHSVSGYRRGWVEAQSLSRSGRPYYL